MLRVIVPRWCYAHRESLFSRRLFQVKAWAWFVQ